MDLTLLGRTIVKSNSISRIHTLVLIFPVSKNFIRCIHILPATYDFTVFFSECDTGLGQCYSKLILNNTGAGIVVVACQWDHNSCLIQAVTDPSTSAPCENNWAWWEQFLVDPSRESKVFQGKKNY